MSTLALEARYLEDYVDEKELETDLELEENRYMIEEGEDEEIVIRDRLQETPPCFYESREHLLGDLDREAGRWGAFDTERSTFIYDRQGPSYIEADSDYSISLRDAV